jgi:hypothetical protein
MAVPFPVRMVPCSALRRTFEIAHVRGNTAHLKKFAPHQFLIREKADVSEIYVGRFGRFLVACECRIRGGRHGDQARAFHISRDDQ